MNVEYELDYNSNEELRKLNLNAPIYLTKQKVYINLIPKEHINFDKFTFSGMGTLSMRFMKTMIEEGDSLIYISINDFFKNSDNMSKLNYLISQGIENQNETGTFDFSAIEESMSSSESDNEESDVSSSDQENSNKSEEQNLVNDNLESIDELDTEVENFEDQNVIKED